MTQPTIYHLALRGAADAVTASLDGELPAELADAPPRVQEEYVRAIKGIAAGIYRRAAEMTKKPGQYSQAWAPWWKQAQDERQTSQLLFEHERWAPACFHALQSIEMALKALARQRTIIAHLRGVTIGELRGTTISQMEWGGEQPREHKLAKLVSGLYPWHRKSLEAFHDRLKTFDDGFWYAATRYPEDWCGDSWQPAVKWHDGFSERDAAALQSLTEEILTVVERRLLIVPTMPDTEV